MPTAPEQYHPEIGAICEQLMELATVTVPKMADESHSASTESMRRWLDALSAATADVCAIASTPYPYDHR
jgi:hypothetical protein